MPAIRALWSRAPILVPHGRRLGGNEIRAAFVGRRMRALEWQPTVNVLGLWGADGTLTYLDLNRGERPIAELRWRVEAIGSAPPTRAAARSSGPGASCTLSRAVRRAC